jgi:hypothetical protein
VRSLRDILVRFAERCLVWRSPTLCQFPPSATLLASHHDFNNHFTRSSPVPRTVLPAGFRFICQPTVSGTSSSNLVCGSDRDGVSPPRLAEGCTTSMCLTTVTPHANRDEPLGPSPISQRGRRDRPSNLFQTSFPTWTCTHVDFTSFSSRSLVPPRLRVRRQGMPSTFLHSPQCRMPRRVEEFVVLVAWLSKWECSLDLASHAAGTVC